MNQPIIKAKKRFRYAARKRRDISASSWKSLERFQTLGLRLAGYLHQFKTPLHVIQSQAELLLEDPGLSPEKRASLSMICRNADRLTAQTQSMMGVARGGDHGVQSESVDRLMEDIGQAALPDCRKKNISLQKDFAAASSIRMDPVALEGALHNIVNNAIESMSEGGTLRLRTFVTSDGERVGVEVGDTGEGMTGRMLARVRKPFQTTKGEGTGLGLFITRHILRRHHARTRWSSVPGRGTVVTITFQKVSAPTPVSPAAKVAKVPQGVWSRLMQVFALLAVLVAPGWATHTPQLLRLQGRFTDSRETPLTDNLPVRFSVWDAADGYGNMLWQDIQTISVKENVFEVILGRTTPLPPSVFSGGDRWLEMQISNDAPLRPRHKIPYQVIQAQVAAPVIVPEAAAPPAPAPLTPEEKRELELQIDRYKDQQPVAAPPPAPKPVVKAVPAPRPKPAAKVTAPVEGGGWGNVYTVRDGDTLKSIAQKIYGNAELWYDLYYLNRDRLGPMGHLFPGQILVLPTPGASGAQH